MASHGKRLQRLRNGAFSTNLLKFKSGDIRTFSQTVCYILHLLELFRCIRFTDLCLTQALILHFYSADIDDSKRLYLLRGKMFLHRPIYLVEFVMLPWQCKWPDP